MTYSTLSSLTTCQQAALPLYRQAARSLMQSTQPVNFARAHTAIHSLYQFMGLAAPRIVWAQSPIAIDFEAANPEHWGKFLGSSLAAAREQFSQSIEAQLSWPVQMALEELLRHPLLELPYTFQLLEQLERNHPRQARRWQQSIKPELWLEASAVEAFALDQLNCQYNSEAWDLFTELVHHCGWLLPYQNVCFVSDRPRQLRLNSQGQLHGEGEAALSFSDGLTVYAHGGVRLPEHYGRLHPRQWQAHWIAEEPNPAVRQVLVEGIGYGRLIQELPYSLVDEDQSGSLVQLEIAGLEEPILLLKRCCAQTQIMDVLRVPPYLRSAQSAACWIHWNLPAVAV